MTTRQKGIRFFELGEEWRNAWILGARITEIAKNALHHPQTVSRAIWLARIPEEIKNKIKKYPDIFSRQILLDTFAAKQKQCEKNGFKKLKLEVERLIEKGNGTKPILKKTNKPIKNQPSTKKSSKANTKLKIDPIFNVNEALAVESKIKKKLNAHCRVSFDKHGGGEIRIFFENKNELEKILENFVMEANNQRKP